MGQEKNRDIHMKRGISKINVGKGQENVGYAEEIYGIGRYRIARIVSEYLLS